jgi:hypothetical protein
LSLDWECTDKSVPFGKYCLSKRLVFSLEPRYLGLSQSELLNASEITEVHEGIMGIVGESSVRE